MARFISKGLARFFVRIFSAHTQVALMFYTPAFLYIVENLHVSSNLVKRTFAIYLFGLAVSQIFYGPISDRIGRKPPFLIGLAIFFAGSIWGVFASTYTSLLLVRFIQGTGVGASMVVNRALLKDVFSGNNYTQSLSNLSVGSALGLSFSPLVGGILADHYSWHADFLFLSAWAAVLFIVTLLFLPETNIAKSKEPLGSFFKMVCSTFLSTFKNKNFNVYLFVGIMPYGVLITVSTMGPFFFQKKLGLSATMYGLLLFFVALAYFIGSAIDRHYVKKLGGRIMIWLGLSIILISNIIILCFSLFDDATIYTVFIPLLFAVAGQALAWPNCIGGALKDFKKSSGSSAALFGVLQMLLSALLSSLLSFFHTDGALQMSGALITLSLLSLLIFFVFKVKDSAPRHISKS